MQHVLIVFIGPVQEFIVSARRTRDLWFGSWLLSELSKAAAQGIHVALGGTDAALQAIVFPGATAVASLTAASSDNVANKILVWLDKDDADIRAVAEAGRTALSARLETIARAVFGGVPVPHFHRDAAEKQLKDLVDFAWVAAPATTDYAQARHDAERLLAMRKNTKSWTQPGWALDGVPKSSLDGIRESVLDEALYDTAADGKRRVGAVQPGRRRAEYGVHGAERLCGVGLLKRLGRRLDANGQGKAERFFSTSHVAALPWMIGAATMTETADALGTFLARLSALGAENVIDRLDVVPGNGLEVFGNIDGSLFYEERLAETLDECGLKASEEAVRTALRTFLKTVKRGEPSPYYAIVLADGDHMGKVIDGQASFADHRNLSRALGTFAMQAETTVAKHHGRLVYSGGDDILAFVPLHTAIACANELRTAFQKALKPWKGRAGEVATLSVGIAVVHHIEPMSHGLALARRAEHLAKERGGRNALAVCVDKRGGATTDVVGQWGALDARLGAFARFHRLDHDALSGKATYDLIALGKVTDEAAPEDQVSLMKIQELEFGRILKAKRSRRGTTPVEEDVLTNLKLAFSQIVSEQAARPNAHRSPGGAVGTLGRELYVAQLMARAQDQANVPLPLVHVPAEEQVQP